MLILIELKIIKLAFRMAYEYIDKIMKTFVILKEKYK